MSSIHYKFRATVELKTVRFEGLHILCSELKREIYNKENIRAESFDLILTNAQTRRGYLNDEMVPRNATIIVQRIPKEGAEKAPKIPKGNGGLILKNGPSTSGEASMSPDVIGHLDQAVLDSMTEEERSQHMIGVSTSKYHSTNFAKRLKNNIMSGPPPPTYVCNRCNQSGHWYQNCPMEMSSGGGSRANTRKATGMTMDELIVTTSDDPHALLHSSGKYVVPRMHHLARQHKSTPNQGSSSPADRIVPPQYLCPLCNELLKNAMIITCCSGTFCDECISQELMSSDERQCPSCKKTGLSLDNNLIPNEAIRRAVHDWISSASGMHPDHVTSSPNIENEVPGAVHRVRIGIGPSAPSIQPAIRDLNAIPAATGASNVDSSSLPPATQAGLPQQTTAQVTYQQSLPGVQTVPLQTAQPGFVPVMPTAVPAPAITLQQPSTSMSMTLLPPGVESAVRLPSFTGQQYPSTHQVRSGENLAPPGVTPILPSMNVPPPILPQPNPALPSGLSAVELVQRTILGSSTSYGMNFQTAAFAVPGGPVPTALQGQNNLDQWNQFLAVKDYEKRKKAHEERKRRKDRRRSSSSDASSRSSGSSVDRHRRKREGVAAKRRRNDDYYSRSRRSHSRDNSKRTRNKAHAERKEERGKKREDLERRDKRVEASREEKNGQRARETNEGKGSRKTKKLDQDAPIVVINDEDDKDDEAAIDKELQEAEQYRQAEEAKELDEPQSSEEEVRPIDSHPDEDNSEKTGEIEQKENTEERTKALDVSKWKPVTEEAETSEEPVEEDITHRTTEKDNAVPMDNEQKLDETVADSDVDSQKKRKSKKKKHKKEKKHRKEKKRGYSSEDESDEKKSRRDPKEISQRRSSGKNREEEPRKKYKSEPYKENKTREYKVETKDSKNTRNDLTKESKEKDRADRNTKHGSTKADKENSRADPKKEEKEEKNSEPQKKVSSIREKVEKPTDRKNTTSDPSRKVMNEMDLITQRLQRDLYRKSREDAHKNYGKLQDNDSSSSQPIKESSKASRDDRLLFKKTGNDSKGMIGPKQSHNSSDRRSKDSDEEIFDTSLAKNKQTGVRIQITWDLDRKK